MQDRMGLLSVCIHSGVMKTGRCIGDQYHRLMKTEDTVQWSEWTRSCRMQRRKVWRRGRLAPQNHEEEMEQMHGEAEFGVKMKFSLMNIKYITVV